MDQNRLFELALQELERQKAAVDAEIGAIRAELSGARAPRTARAVAVTVSGRRRRTAAERKAQSERMRKIWAARRQRAAAAKKGTSPGAKAERAAVSSARSESMKAAWARRKAKEARKTAKTGSTPEKVPQKPSES